MSIWTENRLPGAAPYHALGLWHPTGKLGSAAYFPPAWERRMLRGKARFQYTFNFPNLAAGQVSNDGVSVISDFFWTDSIASVTSLGVLVTQLGSISLFETESEQKYGNLQIAFDNFAGGVVNLTGVNVKSFPLFERHITKIRRGSQLNMRLQNAAAVSVSIQVVLGGYVD